MSLNLKQVRGIDPIFTKFAQGYIPQGAMVAEFIAPTVPTPVRAGQVVTFGKDSFAIEETKRTPGSNILSYTPQYDFTGYSLTQDALAASIPIEHVEESEAVGLNGLQLSAIRVVLDKLALGREKAVIDLISDSSLYETSCTGTVSTKWNAANSTPLADVLAAKEAVRAQIGAMPNSMVVSPKVYNALVNNDEIKSHYNPTTNEMLDDTMLARYFRLSRGIRVAERVYLDETTGLLADLMDEEALLFYAPSAQSLGSMSGSGNPFSRFDMSFAYQYVLEGYPKVKKFMFNEDNQTYTAPVIIEQSPVLTGLGATGKVGGGFLFTDLLT